MGGSEGLFCVFLTAETL